MIGAALPAEAGPALPPTLRGTTTAASTKSTTGIARTATAARKSDGTITRTERVTEMATSNQETKNAEIINRLGSTTETETARKDPRSTIIITRITANDPLPRKEGARSTLRTAWAGKPLKKEEP